jgi:hypothetical protein
MWVFTVGKVVSIASNVEVIFFSVISGAVPHKL